MSEQRDPSRLETISARFTGQSVPRHSWNCSMQTEELSALEQSTRSFMTLSEMCVTPGSFILNIHKSSGTGPKGKKKIAQSLLAPKLPNLLKPKNETTKVRFKLTSLSRLKRHVKGFLFLSFPKETLRIIIIKLVSSSTPTPQSGNTVSGCI